MREDRPPEPTAVQVISYDGDDEVRVASLDIEERALVLHQVSLGAGGELSMGGTVTIKLGSVGALEVQGKAIKLRAAAAEGRRPGKVLLELQFDGPDSATVWASAMQKLRGSGSVHPQVPGAPSGIVAGDGIAGPSEPPLAMLRKLVEQQEEQAKLLEELNQRKADQLTQLQERLEGALEMLQQGQVAYSTQQSVLVEQQETIAALRARLEVASAAEASCVANASEAARGWSAAAAAARARAAGGSAAAADCTGGNEGGSEDGEDVEDGEDSEEEGEGQATPVDEEEEQDLAERLRGLEEERVRYEAQLREEQSEMASQLQELHTMMQGLGLGSGLEDLLGEELGASANAALAAAAARAPAPAR